MNLKHYLFFILALCVYSADGQRLTGTVKNADGSLLPYASIEVKGKNIGITANAQGKFALQLAAGQYVIICQHVGYERQEKTIVIQQNENQLDFQLVPVQLTLDEVRIKKGEDPAYEIMRNAIKKRPSYKNEWERYSTEVYAKGQLRLRDHPKKFMGEKVDFEDGDTGKHRFLFLTETISTYSTDGKGKEKTVVKASKVSGQSNSYGLSALPMISFYENNVKFGDGANPRGFVSPVADNALHFYRFKYEGAFFEEGRQISQIRVTPRRKFEPLFNGIINIVEDEWRIHSLQLQLTKENGMDLYDTIKLEQLYIPVSQNKWTIKSQVLYPAIKILGFDVYGSFVNIYSSFNPDPVFEKGYFDKTLLKYTDSSIVRREDYWENNRPVPLESDEVKDYVKKDSLEILRQSPAYLDSLDRRRNKLTISKVLLSGMTFSRSKSRSSLSFPPLVEALSYNTVEGVVANVNLTYSKRLDTVRDSRRSIFISPEFRYGFSNHHFNANLTAGYSFGKRFTNSISISGGSDLFQFNNQNPVTVLGSTVGALVRGVNNLKIYEAIYGRAQFWKGLGSGFSISLISEYQDRIPLENTTDFSFAKGETEFTPNRPLPQFNTNIPKHQALMASVQLNWQPGIRYIEFPNRISSISSGHPVFSVNFTQGIRDVLGSDIDYSKWTFRITDDVPLALKGNFQYRFTLGGFISARKVEIPDRIHFIGSNTNLLAEGYLSRFQLVPHYQFSHQEKFYSTLFAEHHFNGFITNKIPLLKKWKWNLVGGANLLYINNRESYIEPFIGIENILKVLRVDYIWGFEKGAPSRQGLRIGIKTPFNSN